MKIIAVVFALLFLLATVGMASATPVKVVTITELCRVGETIAYGIYDTDGTLIDSINSKGFLNLIDEIKKYEEQKGIKLQWSYRGKPGVGLFDTDC